MFGYTGKEVMGTDFHLLLMQQQYHKAFKKGFKKFQTTGEGPIVDNWTEFKAIGKNGIEFPIELSVSGTKIKGKWNSIGIIHDISARKESEQLLNQSIVQLRKAMGGIIHAMALTLERRDPYTAGHQRRVSDIARYIATEMGLSKEVVECVRTSGIIHDIGKITVPAEILSKPGIINENEFALIKNHTGTGHEILKEVEFQWPIAKVVLQHHEKIDGSGYPEGLCGDDILLEARILCVADVVEAMASHRPYRPALGIDAALEEISNNSGRLFDSEVVDACLNVFTSQKFKFN
jgi:PAS domain S-box-containing protein/putative nucleotidyltransferase with HDIG domain